MHLHVLGPGSVGCLIAHHLRQILPTAAHSITLIHKTAENRLQFLKKGGITVERHGVVTNSGGEFLHECMHGMGPSTQAPSSALIDTVLVTLKAQHTTQALLQIAPRITRNSTIVLMQNGMGVYEELLHRIFRNPTQRPNFVIASNTHGTFSTAPYHVVHAGLGSIEFAIPSTHERDFESGLHDPEVPIEDRRLRLSDITQPSDPHFQRYKSLREIAAALLLAQPLNTSWVPFDNLQLTLKRKLVVNAVVNPLTALMGCRNGDLFSHQPALDILSRICSEASSVFYTQHQNDIALEIQELQNQGIDTQDIDIPPISDYLCKDALEQHVLQIANRTKGNFSSMLQDVRRGRDTEIPYINGYLERLGQELGVETPTISMLKSLVELKHFLPVEPIL